MNAIANPAIFDGQPVGAAEFTAKIEAAGLLIRAAAKLRAVGDQALELERRAEALARDVAAGDRPAWKSEGGVCGLELIAIHVGSVEDAVENIADHLEFLETPDGEAA